MYERCLIWRPNGATGAFLGGVKFGGGGNPCKVVIMTSRVIVELDGTSPDVSNPLGSTIIWCVKGYESGLSINNTLEVTTFIV